MCKVKLEPPNSGRIIGEAYQGVLLSWESPMSGCVAFLPLLTAC